MMTLLKRYRLATGMSQREVARKLRVTNTAYSYWESGRNLPHPRHIRQLATVLAVNAMELTHILCPEPQHNRAA